MVTVKYGTTIETTMVKKTKLIFKSCLIFTLCLFILHINPPFVFADNQQNINFPTNKARPIPKLINGVNQNWFHTSPYYYNFNLESLDQLGSNLVRFPGGTVANYYNWETFAPDWNVGKKISPKLYKMNQKLFNNYVKNLNPIPFIRDLNKHNKQVILVLNVYSNTPQQIAIGLQKIKNAGLEPKYFELGNEMYFYTPIKDYFKKSELIAKKVKTIFPNAKIGIVVNKKNLWSSTSLETSDKTHHMLNWSQDIPNADWYDAIIIHAYIGSSSKLKSQAEQINHILSKPLQKMNHLIEKAQTKYPGKEIWFTEWNIFETKNKGFFITDTYAYAVFHYNFILSMLNFPNLITLANHHNIWGLRSPQFALLYPKETIKDQYYAKYLSPPNNTYSANDIFIKSTAYWPVYWINQAFKKYTRFTFLNNETTTAAYFFNPDRPKNGSIAIINKTQTNQKITFPNITNQTHLAFILSNKWLAKNNENKPIEPTTKKITRAITLPPIAIAYIEPDPSSHQIKIGDLNQDNKVNNLDYQIFLTNFGKKGSPGFIPSDINKDGIIDIFDYNLLIKNFEK